MLSKQEIFILNVEIQCLAGIRCFCFDTALTSDNVRNLTYMAVYFIDLKLYFSTYNTWLCAHCTAL